MDSSGHIYKERDEGIPEEDKARLDGFLRGRAESDAMRKETEEEMSKLRDELDQFRHSHESGKAAFSK